MSGFISFRCLQRQQAGGRMAFYDGISGARIFWRVRAAYDHLEISVRRAESDLQTAKISDRGYRESGE